MDADPRNVEECKAAVGNQQSVISKRSSVIGLNHI